jgi:hypothetical protein
MSSKGLCFIVPKEYRVAPGPGRVNVRQWLYQEQTTNNTMSFRDGLYYVFCLDREPIKQWLNGAQEPSCDMNSELQHVVSIIEINPTFHFNNLSGSSVLYLTRENLLVYREERYSYFSTSYELEYAVVRKGDNNNFECVTPKGSSSASSSVIQKLLYALNSCSWQQQKGPHRFEKPAVGRTLIEYLDSQGVRDKVVIEFDTGGWHLKHPKKMYYSTFFPDLLYAVENDIVTACAQGSQNRNPNKPDSGDGK